MKRTIALLFVLAIFSLALQGKGNDPVLRFNQDGKFKIVQFTDIHYQVDSYRSDSALVLIKTVVHAEKPDLIVFSGDVVCSKNTIKAWNVFSKEIAGLKVPWAVVFGNHDIEYELTGRQIMDIICEMPYSVTENGPDDVSGNGNYVLPLFSSKSDIPEALIYCFDSHSSFKPRNNMLGMGTYHWIDFSQINWYRNESKNFAAQNNGKPLPALAFFHIPLPEYKEILGKSTTYGSQIEKICCPDINSGLYAEMLACNDVMGVFVGHDHNNNYIGCLRGICLAYGNATGRQCYGSIGRGARVIELVEGERKFNTWIQKMYECNRDSDIWFPAANRQPQYYVTYPDSFFEPDPASTK